MQITDLASAVLFMKVGFHATESLDQIILRKQMEEQQCGVFYWGYGGTLCHPTRQVIPFASAALKNGTTPQLLMSLTPSQHVGDPKVATEFSVDSQEWQSLPSGAVIKGSRFALVCRNLKKFSSSIDLAQYTVAIGPSEGRPVSEFMRFRVDKACAVWQPDNQRLLRQFQVSFRANIVHPFAVFVR